MTDAHDWQQRCRELDRFRWLQLRQRHGIVGSALRLARELISDIGFGWRARAALCREVQAEPCELLLLQASPKVIELNRKKLLKQALRTRGHALSETALDEPARLIRARQLCQPAGRVPLRYFGHAAHAQWLVERYQPRLLLNDRNGSLFSPFLRLALRQRGGQLVQLAHATTVEASRRLDMTDYDYYFLFGRSSLEALQARPLRFGTCRAVLCGSHMIDRSYELPPADPALRTLLILGVGPDKEKEAGYQQTYQLLRDWAASTPDYRVLVKAHPRSQVPFWQQAAAELDNLEVLPADCTLAEALGSASLVVNIMSNAVIEAALAGRPLLYVNASGERDIFEQERFLGACIDSAGQLAQAVQRVSADFDTALACSQALAEHHLAHGSKGLETCVMALESLLQGELPAVESQLLRASPEALA